MRISELARYTSGTFRFRSVLSEVKELLEARSSAEVWEESKDVVTSFLLWLYCTHGIDVNWPSVLSSGVKCLDRMELCREVMEEEGLMDWPRHEVDPYYWMKYATGGSNVTKAYKREAFIKAAKADRRNDE